MFRSSAAMRRGAGVGGVATVATLWMGERSLGQASSRAVNKTAKNFVYHARQPRSSFSTKPSPSSTVPPPKAPPPPPSATDAASVKPSNGFMEWYEGHLQANPVATKMVTGCFLWSIGDAVAQLVPQMASNGKKDDFQYDLTRTGRAALFGFALHAPTSHVHFNFLEWLTNRVGVTGLGIPVFKAFMEQFVYWGWISNAMYLGAMGAMQGHSGTQIYDKIHDSLWGLMKAQWTFWIPVQLLNFQFIPVRHQLNVVLLTSIVWTALLSFWYPPEPQPASKALEDDTKKDKEEN